ncbi:hypothetical protein QYM36_013279 [Artemia franciscana]|uniref:Uncharacterized protein n=1 Tax=Artemia franciscana TaxID=6661 RepID=A0AA88HDV5_ARTSF|nr:hypothetical protein QYM36_013279 [Artemia franciscana]
MLATCALLPALAEDLFLSDDESDQEFISKRDSKMEHGKTTIFSMFTTLMPTKDGREEKKQRKRGRKALKLISARAITAGKVSKELLEILPVTQPRGSTREKADRKITQNFTENTRKLPSLFYKTTSDSIVVRPRIVENRPWVRKPTRPLNLGKS